MFTITQHRHRHIEIENNTIIDAKNHPTIIHNFTNIIILIEY